MRPLLQAAARLVVLALLATPAAAFAQSSASAFTTGTRYDEVGRVTGTIAPDPDDSGPLHHAAVRNTYDDAGRLIRVEKGELSTWQDETVKPVNWAGFSLFSKVEITYDALDRKTLETVSGWNTGTLTWTPFSATQYSYDAVGRLECTAQRMKPAVYSSLPASACTPRAADTGDPDRVTRTVYDAAGQVLSTQKAYGITLANGFPATLQQDYESFTYDLDGKPLTMTDANGQTASMTYDGHERQDSWHLPAKTAGGTPSATDFEAYSYDTNGNRLSLRKRDGCTINYSYDALNRMAVKDLPYGNVGGVYCGTASDVYYGYDLRGLQLYARFVSATGLGITNDYDGFGRLKSTANNMSGTAKTLYFEWDANGNRTSIKHTDSTVTDPRIFIYEYDGLDRPVAIRENGTTTIVADTYDQQGRRASETRGGVTTSYTYDLVSRLASLSDDLADTGNDVTSSFAYNPASQVVHKTRSNDLYRFNAYPGTPVSRAYAPNGLNQYGTAGSTSFTYDANGNLTGSSNPTDGAITYTYDVENRLLSASGPTATTLQYDPLGRLWRLVAGGVTSEFTWDGDAMVAVTSSGATQRFVHGNGEDDPLIRYDGATLANRYSLQADAQGSIVSMASASGTLAGNILSYDEYGIPGLNNDGLFQYTGQIWLPSIGMYYYKARIYSPTLGRFLQVDPIGYKDQNNLYAYVGNDPLDKADPTGLQQTDDDPVEAEGRSRRTFFEGETNREDLRWTEFNTINNMLERVRGRSEAWARSPGSAPSRELIHQTYRDLADTLTRRASTEPYNASGLTRAGRSLTDHPEVLGMSKPEFQRVYRQPWQINEAGARVVRSIVYQGRMTILNTRSVGPVINYERGDGYQARFIDSGPNAGQFVGFANPRRP